MRSARGWLGFVSWKGYGVVVSARIFIVSDTHFQHKNIYKFIGADGVTRVRPQFKNTKEADAEMVKRWNAAVKPSDHVWHLGDVGWGAGLAEIVESLNGHKRLILGNHDKEKMRSYTAMGFQKIQGSHYVDGAWLTHIPIHQSSLHGARINLHGHIHEAKVLKWNGEEVDEQGKVTKWVSTPDKRYVNCCVEHTDYRPMLLHELVARAERG